ncbi:hypothetical protein I0C86_08830 [Plantactinospora sp. S1510]|uniref:Uncharacterized protein n=1 Tax=Plantactinospora alkalitolerans TaxID=2789879 RepID=A0ABS0GSC9_9ACTN|nr:hypothetical protein [Plantactinospora alkalitolerans]MBF9129085.1 hypothetical protein [Plantactinospora alkalitolerans]
MIVGTAGRAPLGDAGARIGMNFALLESTTVLTALLRRFRVNTTGQALRLRPLLTLRPDGPVLARMTEEKDHGRGGFSARLTRATDTVEP